MAQSQKKPIIEDDFEPIEQEDDFTPDTNEQKPVDDRGMLRKTWDALTNPLVDIPIGDAIDSPSEFRSPTRARIEGFVGGAAQGLVDDAVSPLGIATAGGGSLVTKAGKGLIRGAGKGLELVGEGLKHNPLTSWLPPIAEPRMLRSLQTWGGKGLEYVGNKMRGVGSNIERYMPNKSGARVQNLERNAPMDFGPPSVQRDMPNTSGYTGRYADEPIDFGPNSYDQYMPNSSGYKPSLDMPLQEGDDLLESFKVIRNETPETGIKVKPRVKPNKDGTFTNLDTGEVLDSRGDSIIEINGKPVDRNSFIFKKNRQ